MFGSVELTSLENGHSGGGGGFVSNWLSQVNVFFTMYTNSDITVPCLIYSQ